MPALKNCRHERFAQNVVSGLNLSAAYVAAGYRQAGASANAARLLRSGIVSERVNELRNEIAVKFVESQITTREERLKALQARRDAVLEAMAARAVGDYDRMMATGIVCRKERMIGSGKNARLVQDYEIDTGAIEALNSIERRAAIETGQEVHRKDVNIDASINQHAELLAATFTLEQLEVMMTAAERAVMANAEKQETSATAAAISSGEDGGIPVTAEVVDEGRPKQDEPTELDIQPDIPEWMR
jgi:phage terminase small subunit